MALDDGLDRRDLLDRQSRNSDRCRPTLENAFKGGGVHLVVAPIDYSENTRVLVDELREKLKQVVEPTG